MMGLVFCMGWYEVEEGAYSVVLRGHCWLGSQEYPEDPVRDLSQGPRDVGPWYFTSYTITLAPETVLTKLIDYRSRSES